MASSQSNSKTSTGGNNYSNQSGNKRGGSSSTNSAANSTSNSHTNTNASQNATSEDVPSQDPLNFESFPVRALRKYKTTYNMPGLSSISEAGALLNGSVGKKTYSYKHRNRISKEELAGNVKKHFTAQTTRETEMIACFLYATNNQKNAFKLHFPLS
ncbi:hypothetical protein V1511DRAFT_491857 [Dipodascopsis uninucleata]